MSNPGVWKTWEGRVVDGKFPLRQWLGGSDHSAVFLTERPGQPSPKLAIKLVVAEVTEADRQISRWRAASQLEQRHRANGPPGDQHADARPERAIRNVGHLNPTFVKLARFEGRPWRLRAGCQARPTKDNRLGETVID